MFAGPVFSREAAVTPRRPRFYLYRAIYVAGLLLLMSTAWLVLAGTQKITNVGDMSRFGAILFQILSPIQLSLVLFFSAISAASAVSQEKDRQTFILLLMTRLSNLELVVGKLLASLLNVFVMLAAALPVFMLIVLFGGVSFGQVFRVFAVTILTALAAGTLGSVVALWREKTFQTLAITALVLVFWLGVWQAVHGGLFGDAWGGVSTQNIATGCSPVLAILAAAKPAVGDAAVWSGGVGLFFVVSVSVIVLLNAIAIMRVRAWNPTREVRIGQTVADEDATIWGAEHDLATQARSGHVDSRTREPSQGKSRRVWDNPILWREVCTWAYGRKVLLIRAAYLVLFLMAAGALWVVIQSGEATGPKDETRTVTPVAARPLTPFMLVSLVIMNALAVTSITNERDGRALDLLLVTDLSPREFVLGKIGGVLWLTKEMYLLPLALCCYLWWSGGLSLEHLLYITGGVLVMSVFVTMLGIHCGMIYANSRTAISVSLGSVFFLFLGVVTCMMMMISFSGSFQTQLAPFLAFILGGGVGLFVSLGARNPSPAIAVASLLLPFATFYAITSFLLGYFSFVFLVCISVYGFTTAAMLMPAIGEFNIAMGGRARSSDEE